MGGGLWYDSLPATHQAKERNKMRNHYDMQHEVVEAAHSVIVSVERHGDTLGLDALKLKLAESARRFSKHDLIYLQAIAGHAESIGDEANEDWILAQPEIFDNRFRRLLAVA
jgi:hypothetical protein